eukprot:1158600-Pelagomonas_calceolata.AAC.5
MTDWRNTTQHFINQADVLGIAKPVLLQLSCPRRQEKEAQRAAAASFPHQKCRSDGFRVATCLKRLQGIRRPAKNQAEPLVH